MGLVTPMRLTTSWLLLFLLAGALLLTISCAKQEPAMAPEEPPTRGERDRVMSELHGTRKLLLDAIEAVSDERFKAPLGDNQPSPSEAVEALVIRERNLLTAMGAATVTKPAPEAAPEGLSREQREARDAAQAKAFQESLDACVAKIGPDGFRVMPNPAILDGPNLAQGFRAARDANIAFARETTYNFQRRTIKDAACGEIDLRTAMMLQAKLTEKVAEMVASAQAKKK
jgi:hypothetical protein